MPARKHVHQCTMRPQRCKIAPPPSWIDLAPCRHRIPPMLDVRSPCLRASTPTRGQICTGIQCRCARREKGIEGYRAQMTTASDSTAHPGQFQGTWYDGTLRRSLGQRQACVLAATPALQWHLLPEEAAHTRSQRRATDRPREPSTIVNPSVDTSAWSSDCPGCR